jgi:hypothetical protein
VNRPARDGLVVLGYTAAVAAVAFLLISVWPAP